LGEILSIFSEEIRNDNAACPGCPARRCARARVAVRGTFAISEGDEPPQAWHHWVVVVGETMPMQDAYELADRCIGEWHVFLHEHGLTAPPP
jgi:hypothetical protein